MPGLYAFLDNDGTFRASRPERFGPLYFPLVNEAGIFSAVAPDLAGDIKTGQHTFLTVPVSTEDLHLSRTSRNFWLGFPKKSTKGSPRAWSVTGASAWQKSLGDDEESSEVEAGLLWHKLTRRNAKLGIEARTLNFVPAAGGTFEVMQVEVRNISKGTLVFTATSAVPLYGRSADNLRDHRHVTSLLHRLKKDTYGLRLCPTMTFNERGHSLNTTSYYIAGTDSAGEGPAGLYPTVASFVGEGGTLDRPAAIFDSTPPAREITPADQGREAMGALQFKPCRLAPGETAHFTLLLGIEVEETPLQDRVRALAGRSKVLAQLKSTQDHWAAQASKIIFHTGDSEFNRWMKWVGVQPIFRRLFGNSFLPDFDYGKGGRGWRDLWQDCLALLLSNPAEVRQAMLDNFGGVRIDGSNATIIGRAVGGGEFIADRNNITRTWMDHGVWPGFTTQLYLHQTGDWDFLLEKASYFRDGQLRRGRAFDAAWAASTDPERGKLKTRGQRVYAGTVLEHILVQVLVQFFNVGPHNMIRLEDADWNDGLDMAPEKGESVAFTAMYAGLMESLAATLSLCMDRAGWKEITIAEEVVLLLDRAAGRINYDNAEEKRRRLEGYFDAVSSGVKGDQASLPLPILIHDLREKAAWLKRQVNQNEWIEEDGEGWYNGYYDNTGARVEGKDPHGRVRMTLTGQVYPLLAGLADDERARRTVKAVDRCLFDKDLGGIRLNTDFGAPQPALGRAFAFVYGEKENGAVFSHMVVMYANALYQRGLAAEGRRALESLYQMAKNSERSSIYPGLPEYFNTEGRGRYCYLTGSASWYVLTLLTQVFGVRGEAGDLLLAPKLDAAHFDGKREAAVEVTFAGSRLKIIFHNPERAPYGELKITRVRDGGGDVPFTRRSAREVLIQREIVAQRKEWEIHVDLEKT